MKLLAFVLLCCGLASAQIPAAAFGIHEHNVPNNGWPSVNVGSIRTWDTTQSTGNVDWDNLETCAAASSNYTDPCFHFTPNIHSATLGGLFDIYTAHGVDIVWTFGTIPCWARGVASPCDTTILPSDVAGTDLQWKNFVTAFFSYVRDTFGNGTITLASCGNEPNDNPAKFINGLTDTNKTNLGRMCRDLYTNAKAIDPAVLIGTPEPQGTSLDNWLDTYFTDVASVCSGTGNNICADVVTAHFYLGRSFGICPSAWMSPCLAPVINAVGSGYAAGDIVNVTQAGASGGQIKITSVSGGAVAGIAVYKYGAGYITATGLSTTAATGTGSGFKVNITSPNTSNTLPGSFDNLPETAGTLVDSLKTVMSGHGVSALPIWDTENGFGKVPFWPNTDLQSYFAAAQTITALAHGVARTFKYAWSGDPFSDPNNAFGFFYNKGNTAYTSHGTTCLSKKTCVAATAYQAVHDWLVGSTFTDHCTSPATVIQVCNLTLLSGAPAQIIWDTSKSCMDDPAGCDTAPFTVGAQYLTVKQLDGTSASIVSHSVSLGTKPLMVIATVPASGNAWGGKGTLGGKAVVQ